MAVERTFVMIKPDGVQRGLIGPIVSRFERKGLKLVGIKLVQPDEDLARKHYAAHVDKPFFPSLLEFITRSPVVAMAWEGNDAVELVRKLMGPTNAVEAPPGTIRGDYGQDIGYNLIHGSDSLESARKELALWFREEELIPYDRATDPWLREPESP